MPKIVKRFTVTDPSTGADVLGGPVSEHNTFVALTGAPDGADDDRHPSRLAVGESVLRVYSIGGRQRSATGVARVTRIEDGETSEL